MAIESWLVNRRLTEMAGPWNERLSMDDDGEYFSRVIVGSDSILFVPEAKCFCRKGDKWSLSSNIKLSEHKLKSQFLSIRFLIERLRSLEDSERTRSASIKYLQTYLLYFYPENKALIEEAITLARELGGRLSPPALNWKYSLIKACLGWRAAKHAMSVSSSAKLFIFKNWDQFLFNLSGHY